jgi:DNA-directed RNA polymerase subunit RPC12/RpoP
MPLPGDPARFDMELVGKCKGCGALVGRKIQRGDLFPALAYCPGCGSKTFVRSWAIREALDAREGVYTLEQLIMSV